MSGIRAFCPSSFLIKDSVPFSIPNSNDSNCLLKNACAIDSLKISVMLLLDMKNIAQITRKDKKSRHT